MVCQPGCEPWDRAAGCRGAGDHQAWRLADDWLPLALFGAMTGPAAASDRQS